MNRLLKKKEIEEKLVSFINSYIDENESYPTLREIAKELNIKSLSTISAYVENLKQNGKLLKLTLKNTQNKEEEEKFVGIPMLGKVTAGVPILAVENKDEVLYFPQNTFKGQELFILTVSGNSMINAGIKDGDKIVVKKQNYAENGEIVVALIENESATVKRYLKANDKVILRPENPDYKDIILSNVKILGVVTGLIRSF